MEEDIEVKRSFLREETFVILVFFSQERLLKEKPSGKYLAGIVHSYVQMQLFFPQYDTVGDAELMLEIIFEIRFLGRERNIYDGTPKPKKTVNTCHMENV